MSDEHFAYEPLDTTKKCIRLVTFLPQQADGMIRLHMYNCVLDNVMDSYYALSYTWGPENPIQHIRINGKQFSVRENLGLFLEHYYNGSNVPKPLWIDSICINQRNIPEKNYQVSMMGDIFQRASHVIVWLGNSSISSRVGEILSSHNLLGPLDAIKPLDFESIRKQLFPDMYELYFRDHQPKRVALPVELHDHIMQDLLMMCQNNYWQRLWIVQELLLAKQALVICQHTLISVDYIFELVTLYRFRQSRPILQSALEEANRSMRKMEECRQKKVGGLTDLVTSFFKQQCTDHRDRIYGLISCSPDRYNVIVDYAAPAESLIARILSVFIARWQSDPEGSGEKSLFAFACILFEALKVTSSSFEAFLSISPNRRAHHDQLLPTDIHLSCLLRPCSDDEEATYTIVEGDLSQKHQFRQIKPYYTLPLCKLDWQPTDWLCLGICSVVCIAHLDASGIFRVKGFLWWLHKAPKTNDLKVLPDSIMHSFESQLNTAHSGDSENSWNQKGKFQVHLTISELLIASKLVQNFDLGP